jgi:hypothetical protein
MKRVVFVAVLGAFLATPVLASVSLKQTNVSPGLTVQVSSTGYDGWTSAGIYNLDITSSTVSGLIGATEAFCIDIWDVNPSVYVEYEAVSLADAPDPGAGPMHALKASQLAQLLDTYWNSTALASNLNAAALQTAVWEVVDERLTDATGAYVYNVTTGNFRVVAESSIYTLGQLTTAANNMLASINSGADSAGYLALTNSTVNNMDIYGNYTGLGKYQDYVVKVPVPAAFVLGLLGLGAAGARLRKQA